MSNCYTPSNVRRHRAQEQSQMKTTYLPLVELSSLTVAAALVLVPRWVAMTYLELDGAPATLIGITCLGIAFTALVIWLKREETQ